MKKVFLVFAAAVLCVCSANAAVTVNVSFGSAFDSVSAAVPNGTLWVMIADSDDNSSFAGGFNINSSLTNAVAAAAAFGGQSLSVGTVIGGDTIFAMGGFNSAAAGGIPGANVVSLTLASGGVNGVATGRNFAIYWFPGLTYGGPGGATGSTTAAGYSVNVGSTFQVGGIHDSGTDAGLGYEALVFPAAGATNPGVANDNFDGTLPDSRFVAVNAVPEPSVALLGGLGVLALLRRRRD